MQDTPPEPARSYITLDDTSRALLDSSIEAAGVVDINGYVLEANDAAAKLFGQKKGEDLKHYNILINAPEGMGEIRRAKIMEAVESGLPVRFEEDINGRTLLYSVMAVSSPWDDVTRIAVHIVDLTVLRRTDEDLRREQQRQIFFMESLPGIVYHLYPDKTIRYANRYFRKYFGSPAGRSCREVLQCSDDLCDGCPPLEAMETDRAVEWDWSDSKGRTFHLQCSPMTDSSGERMIMMLGIDITARKRAEDALKLAHDKLEDRVRQRTMELERANKELTSKSMRLVTARKKADAATRAKSAFLANMSHEIRTPLNAVLGMAELALRGKDQVKKDNYLRRVMEAGNSLLSVINDILDFSKVEARKMTLESIDFDLSRTLEAALDIHTIATGEKSLYLTHHIANNVPGTVVGDPTRLKQVLVNLVSNAVKFTEQGGIHVSISLVSPDKSPKIGDSVTLRFEVTDTGIGIPASKQQDIFDSFLQADDSVTRKHGGTGLGLAICTLLVELMGGRFMLESEEGHGSTFAFTAKFAVGDAANVIDDVVAEQELQSHDIGALSVLLADDNALNRELATTILEENGHTVRSVVNGVEALDALKEEDFDLVLMDVQMPVMDGVTATRAVRDPDSGARDPAIPIIALTAHALVGDRDRFIEAGMNDYIAKPIRMADFYATIARAVQGRDVALSQEASASSAEDQSDGFDRDGAARMLGDNWDLLRRMDTIFLRDVPGELLELQQFMEADDWNEATRMAHSIKGSARTVGAKRCGAVAEQLEFLCKQKDVEDACRELKTLESEVGIALEYLENDQQEH